MSFEALKKRHDQGWVREIFDDVEKLLMRVKEAKKKQEVRFDRVLGETQGWSNRIGPGKSSGFVGHYFIHFWTLAYIMRNISFLLENSSNK